MCLFEFSFLNYCSIFLIGGILIYFLIQFLSGLQTQRKLDRWSQNVPKNLVILHGFPRGKLTPNNSPFVLKLETYLRMAKIPYKYDFKDYFGPKGKTPWITLNGEHVTDSQLIIEYLQKKFEPKIDNSYSQVDLAIGGAFRLMLEEHFFWGLVLDRFVYHGDQFKKIIAGWNWLYVHLYRFIASLVVKNQTYNQGLGRHSKEDIIRLTCDDLFKVSKFLGNKKFLLGDEPCTDDSGVFGQLAQVVWSLPNSDYEKLVKGELRNLEAYCIRMKERFFPDWESCLG